MVATFQAKTAIRATGLAMLFMLVFLAVILVVESYNSDRAKADISVHRGAHVVATQFDWMFQASAHALQRIEDSVSTSQPGTTAQQIQMLGSAVDDLPPGFSYAVYDGSGTLTHSSEPNQNVSNIAAEPWFRAAKAGTELALAPSMSKAATATDSFLMIRRLDRGGPFAGVATVSIPTRSLAVLAETLGLGTPSTITLVRTDGALLARNPVVQPMNLSGWRPFAGMLSRPDGSFEARSPVDGVSRIIGYWRLPNWPVIALAGMDQATALRPFWQNLFTSAVLALPILLGMGWLVLDLIQLMRTDELRQTALSSANQRTNFLLREIHHRVKNNLQTVSSLIRLEDLPATVQSSLLGRIGAMVAVHEVMYRSDQFEEICVAPYLERLVENIAQSQGGSVTARVEIAPIRLSGDRAMQLGLLVNELVANAFKHAFSTRRCGTLNVAMREIDGGLLRLIVSDDGPGYDQGTRPRQMGGRLVDAFASQLGGTVRIESEGSTTVTVEFPKDYGGETPAPQRSAQPTSIAGVRSIASMRLSKFARSSKRT